jgi:hypothetical protein
MIKHDHKEEQLARQAKQALAKQERERQVEQRVADEAKRLADTAAKTVRLRKLRLAKEAEEQLTAAQASYQK